MFARICSHVLLAVFLLLASGTALAKGRLGFSVQVATSGLFSTMLQEITVAVVHPGSPAARAGLRVGDIITELNGQRVKGSNGFELKAELGNVTPGEPFRLVVLRPDGEILQIQILTAIDAPPKPAVAGR